MAGRDNRDQDPAWSVATQDCTDDLAKLSVVSERISCQVLVTAVTAN